MTLLLHVRIRDRTSILFEEYISGGDNYLKFFYVNECGDNGYFVLKKTEIPKAIMSAWNIEADLSIVTNEKCVFQEKHKLIFSPSECNECNNDWLKEYGLYIKDGERYRELHYISDGGLAWEPDNYEGILRLN